MMQAMSDSDREIIEIAEDWPCRKCGYDLQGADVAGRCPECGELVGDSLSTRPGPTWMSVILAWVFVLAAVVFLFLVLMLVRP